MSLHRHTSVALYLGITVILADQLSKWWVLKHVGAPPDHVVLAPFLNLVLVYNRGVTFGLLNTIGHEYMPFVLAGVAAVILFFLGRWLWRTRSLPVAIGLGAIMGGAVGNVVDRMRYGAVVDFIDFYVHNYHWYAFNVADAAIVTGVGLLLLDSLVRAR